MRIASAERYIPSADLMHILPTSEQGDFAAPLFYGLCSLLTLAELIQLVNVLNLTYYPMVGRLTAEAILHISVLGEPGDRYLVIVLAALALSCLFWLRRLLTKQGRGAYVASLVLLVVSFLFANYDPTLFAVMSLGMVLALLAVVVLDGNLRALLQGQLICLVALEVLSTAYWLLFPVLGDPLGSSPLSGIASVEAKLFYAFSSLSPCLLLLAVFVWLLGPLARLLRGVESLSFDHTRLKLSVAASAVRPKRSDESSSWKLNRESSLAMLAIAIVVSVVMAILPYMRSVNPTGTPVGTDVPQYAQELGVLLSLPPSDVVLRSFTASFGGSRPAFTIFMYGAAVLSGLSAFDVAKYLPLVLGPLLVISTYLMMRMGQSSESTAALAAFITAVSPTSVGISYGGLFANWLALSTEMLAIGLLCGAISENSHRVDRLLLSGIMLGLTSLIHPWTWMWAVAGLGAYLVSTYLLEKMFKLGLRWRDDFKAVAIVTITSFLVDLSRSIIFGTQSGLSLSYGVVTAWSGIVNLFLVWENLSYALRIILGGTLSSFVIFALAAVGGYDSTGGVDRLGWLLTSFLMIASFWLPLSNAWGQQRILLVTPFPALAALGLRAAATALKGKEKPGLSILFVVLVLLFCSTCALRSVITMVPQQPIVG
jgi:hypothetical protein